MPWPSCPRGGRRLHLYLNRERVGTLHENNDVWAPVYEREWADKVGSFDLSPALPRRQLVHRDGSTVRAVQWYFENLLPEGQLRELTAAEARLRDQDDAFALLEYLGAESVGALTLLPPGEEPPSEARLHPLTYEALNQRILSLPNASMAKQAPKRITLAGTQHKLSVVLRGDELYEPVGATLSTHILKPDHPASETYPASTYLEWLTMRLALAARLEVPSVRLLHVPEPVYVIERFDRRFEVKSLLPETGMAPPTVERVHVIDGCQLLNKARLAKYGASVHTLRELVRACGDELTTPIRLFRWLVFNLLVANDDCHLKNLSFVASAGRLELAPHYDLLATGVYHTPAFADGHGAWPAVPLALRLSDTVTRFDQVTPEAVLDAGLALGVPPVVAKRATREVISRTLREFDLVCVAHSLQNEDLIDDPTAKPAGEEAEERARSIGASVHEQAPRRKILGALRTNVLPEMTRRLLGG